MTSPSVQLTAAASVAVTTPVNRAYMMIANRTRMSSASGRAWKRSLQVLFSAVGPQSGWRRQMKKTVAAISTVQDGAGDHVAEEELPDGLARVQPVDHQHDARRDQDAEGRPGRDGAGVEHRVVAVFLHRRDGHGAHGRRRRRVRAADGRKGRARP